MKTFLDFLFLLNGMLGILCVFLVGINTRSNRNVNVYLALTLFAVSFRLILRGYIALSNQSDLIYLFSNFDLFLLGIPLPYLYFRNLTKNKSIFEIKDVIHFFLPILLTIEYNSHLFSAQFQIDLLYVFRALLSLNIIYYYTQILIILSKRFWKKKSPVEIQTEQESLMKKWTIILFVAFQTSATKMIWSEIVFGHTDLLSDGFLTWIVWFVVFMMILTSPSILNVYLSQISREPKVTSKKMSHWRLQPIQKITNKQDLLLSQKINTALDAYFQQIDQFIEKEQFFRQSGISINDLAMKLKIPKSHLSFIFKYHSSLSFSDMKKLLRIQQATALIDQGYLKTNTFDSLSKEVGFSTYNSFYIAFKEVTTKAPQEYTSGLG